MRRLPRKKPALNGDHVVRSLDEPIGPRLQRRRKKLEKKTGKMARVRYWWPGEIPFDWIWRFVNCNKQVLAFWWNVTKEFINFCLLCFFFTKISTCQPLITPWGMVSWFLDDFSPPQSQLYTSWNKSPDSPASRIVRPLRQLISSRSLRDSAQNTYSHLFRTEKKTWFCLSRFVWMYIISVFDQCVCGRKICLYILTLHHITLHDITLHCITLNYMTLHDIRGIPVHYTNKTVTCT